MQVLLTGATGFLGNNLLRLLLQDGHDVTVTVRSTSDRRPLDGLDLEVVEADLNDPRSVAEPVGRVDLVIHAAAMVHIGWSRLEASRRINVEGTRTLAEAARRRGIRMVHVSSVDTLAVASNGQCVDEQDTRDNKTPCTYVVTKREAEQAFLEQVERGLDGIVVNPGFMLGPWDWKPSSGLMVLTVANGVAFFAPAGGCSVVDVRDVATGILAAFDYGQTGERYILAGENLTYLDLWRKIASITKSRRPWGVSPNWLSALAGRTGDWIGKCIGHEPLLNSAGTRLGNQFHWYTSDKAQQALGYRIGPVDVAIEDAWRWLCEFGYVKRKRSRK